MALRELAIRTDILKTIPFKTYHHKYALTFSPVDGITTIEGYVLLWKAQNGRIWHLQEIKLPEEVEQELHLLRRRARDRIDVDLLKVAAMIAVYREGIDPLRVRGLTAKLRGKGIYRHSRRAVVAFQAWQAKEEGWT